MGRHFVFLLLICFFLTDRYTAQIVSPSPNQVLYVDSAAHGNGNGSSWQNAIPSLAEALKYARVNSATWINDSLRIYVAKGTYLPCFSAEDGVFFNDSLRENAFVMVNNVQLYGGYPSGGGTRDLAANPTILSGDRGIENDSTDNCYHVVVAANALGNALIDGFEITRGNASLIDSITVNSKEIYSSCGGGINNCYSSITINAVNILKNDAFECGGGMYTSHSSSKISNSLIKQNNVTRYGGGFFCISSSLEITGSIFSNNFAGDEGGAIYDYVYTRPASPLIKDVTITNNIANQRGGGISSYSFVYAADSLPQLYLFNVLISGNVAPEGGGICTGASYPKFENVSICKNLAYSRGGGIYCENAFSVFKNVLIANNKAIDGGGVFNSTSQMAGTHATLKFINTTIANNTALSSGAGAGICNANSTFKSENSIIYGNRSFDQYGTMVINNVYNLYTNGGYGLNPSFHYSYIEYLGHISEGYNAGHSIFDSLSPFIDAANGNFRLSPTSAAINAGSNALYAGAPSVDLDLAGNSRLFGDSIDIGAYECIGTLSLSENPELNSRILLVPNPFQNELVLQIQLEQETEAELTIYNLSGKLIYSINSKLLSGVNKFVLSNAFYNQPIGVYTVRIQTNQGLFTSKVVKME